MLIGRNKAARGTNYLSTDHISIVVCNRSLVSQPIHYSVVGLQYAIMQLLLSLHVHSVNSSSPTYLPFNSSSSEPALNHEQETGKAQSKVLLLIQSLFRFSVRESS